MGTVVLVEAADVEQAIDNICLYTFAWTDERRIAAAKGNGLAPLGLVGWVCGCGDVGAAEEQSCRCEDLVLHRTKGTHLKPPLRCPRQGRGRLVDVLLLYKSPLVQNA